MKFFFDNCLSRHLASAVNSLDQENEITHLQGKFAPDVADHVWIGALATERKWVVVSGDPRILSNPQNAAAWRQSGLTGFFLKKGWMNIRLWDRAWQFVRWWPRITTVAGSIKRGEAYYVPLKGTKLEPVNRGRSRG